MRKIREKCDDAGISYIFKDELIAADNEKRIAEGIEARSLGQTELGRVAAASGGRINGATVQIPTTGYHTRQETATLESVSAFLNLLQSIWK